jgi:hypothetical protein
VFAWWHPGWEKIALTIIGALLIVFALTKTCCCAPKPEAKTEEKKE